MKKINLCFDGRILKCGLSNSISRTGIYFVGRNLIIELVKRENINLSVYLPQAELALKKDIFTSLNIEELPILSDADDFSKINAFFSPFESIPLFIREYPKISCYTVLYDIIVLKFPQYFIGTNSQGWLSELSTKLNFEDYYFSISKYTAEDFIKYFPQLDSNKIKPIPLSSNFDFKPNQDKKVFPKICEKYHIPLDKKYLFSLCSLEPRKNLIRAIKTFIQFIEKNKIKDLVYVLGGGAWEGFMEKFKEEVPEWQQYADKIIRAGYVDDEDLEPLYSNAEWFVYTSQYEGFGMPPLEAMKCGCPVIASNNSSLPEVVGDAGIMIDYDSDEQHVAAYEKYYFNDKYRLSMARKGFERSKQFSWKKTIDIIINQIEDVEAKKNNQPLVTIVTPTFNLIKSGRKDTVQQMMESVHNQTYPNIEHLMIDGASTDGTLNLLEEHKQKGWINYYSEPDKGLYDGINKGILKAKGKYVVILNSDDFYCDNHAVEWLVSKAESTGVDACYGDAIRVNPQTLEIMNYWSGKDNFLPIFGSAACHQTFLIKTEVMKELGLYDLKYKVSADNNFFVKMLAHNKKFASVNRQIIYFRDGGFSNSHFVLSEQERADGTYEEYCKKYGLTKYDAYQLFGYRYLSLPLNEAIDLGSRLHEPKWIYSYFSKLIEYNKNKNSPVTVIPKVTAAVPQGYGFGVKVYKLFNLIPLLKIVRKEVKIKYTLFGIIPLYKHKHIGELNYWKILGIYMLRKRQFPNGIIKYYLFGLPVILRKHIRRTGNEKKICEKIDNEYIKQIKIFNITIYRKIKKTLPKLPMYNFSKENGNIELKGFFEKEDWGRWSNGEECSITFFNYAAQMAIFDIQPFLHDNHPKTEVNVYVNDKQKATWIFELGKQQPDTRISLKPFEKNNIVFEIKNPISPKELGIGEDIRRISIGLRSIKFEEKAKKTPRKKGNKYSWLYNVIDNEYITQINVFNISVFRKLKKILPEEIVYEFNEKNPELKFFSIPNKNIDDNNFKKKKKICISGNCVTEVIPQFLKTNRNFNKKYDVEVLKPVFSVTKDDLDNFKKSVMTCDIFLTQPIGGQKYVDLGIDTDTLKKIIKPTAKLFLMPVPYFIGYFPEQFYLRDNTGASVKTYEGLPSPYHNKIIFYCYINGKSIEQTYKILYSKKNIKNVSKLVKDSLAELSRREERLTFKISDFIAKRYHNRRLFWTCNHPSNTLIRYMAEEILRILGIKKHFWQQRPTVKKISKEFLAGYVTPILPSIVNKLHLRLSSKEKNIYTLKDIQQYYDYYERHKELVELNKNIVSNIM